MKKHTHLLPVTGLVFFLTLAGLSESPAILGLFEKDQGKTVPNPEQLSQQQQLAAQAFAEAQALEASSQFEKAEKAYRGIVKNYPRTTYAAESQFKIGEIYQVNGKSKKAFDAYQEFLANYKSSPRFGEAVQRQFAIAENLRKTGDKGFLGGIGATVQPSKLIEYYQLISANSPKTELAARSYLAIGSIQAKEGDLASAISAYELVVENYPGTKLASEAQYQLFQLHGKESNKSFSPVDMRQQKEAGEDFLALHRSDPRATNVRATLGQLEDRESEKAFNVGRFYERHKNLKSAAVYYREVLKHPGTKHYQDAEKRLGKLMERDPSIAAVVNRQPVATGGGGGIPQVNLPAGVPAPPPSPDVKSRSDYVGPPPPNLETAKPTMRTSDDDVLPIPSDDPANN